MVNTFYIRIGLFALSLHHFRLLSTAHISTYVDGYVSNAVDSIVTALHQHSYDKWSLPIPDASLNSKINGAKREESTEAKMSHRKHDSEAVECADSKLDYRNRTEIIILGLFELSVGELKNIAGENEAQAASIAINHTNQMKVLGCHYRLRMIVNNTKGDPGIALNNFFYAMHYDKLKQIKVILGSSNSEVTRALAKVSLAWNIPTVSFGYSSSQLSDHLKYPMFFRTVPPDAAHNEARIAFLKHFGWTVIATISQQNDEYSWGINDLSVKLERTNITLETSASFPKQDFNGYLNLLEEQDNKIILASFSNEIAPDFFCMVYKMGLYGGDYIWILPGTNNHWWNNGSTNCSRSQLLEAVNGLILVSTKNHLDSSETSISAMNEQSFLNLIPNARSKFIREAYDAVWSISLALKYTLARCEIKNSNCLDITQHHTFQKYLVNNFQHINFKGISGLALFRGTDRISITNFNQIQDGNLHKIAQYDPLKAMLEFECPSCKEIIWPGGYIPASKRTYELHIINVAPVAFYTINSIAVFGIFMSLVFLVFNMYYREQKYIKLSSPYLNVTTIIGCILVYLAVIFLGIDNATLPSIFSFPVICTTRVALLSTGCSLAFGSIFAKTYRVHQIFIKSNHGILKNKILQDSRLVPIIGLFVLVDAVIICVWTVIDPMTRDLYNLTIDASSSNPHIIQQLQAEVCNSEYKTSWLFGLGIYKAIFFVLGLYMAWETRNVKIPSLNDSEHIGLTVYTVMVTTVLHFTLASVTSNHITVAYVTTTSLILFTTTSSMCLLFLPKISATIRHSDSMDKNIVGNSALKIESNTIRFVKSDVKEPYYRVHIQNFTYRKYISFLDKEIQNLHYKIYIKKDDDPDLLDQRATLYDKLPNIRRHKGREKSSSLCGGIPNLFMLTVFPVVIPRASWPYAEHLERPIAEEMAFSSESRLQSIKLESNVLNTRDSEEDINSSSFSSPLRRIFDLDDYQDTSSDVDDEVHNNSVMKICKAIVHSPLNGEAHEMTPTIFVTDVDEPNCTKQLSTMEEESEDETFSEEQSISIISNTYVNHNGNALEI